MSNAIGGDDHTVAQAASGPAIARPAPLVRELKRNDLWDALILGWRDFKRAPQYGLFFGMLYAAGGWSIVLLATVSGLYYLAYPLAAGFAIVAPFICAGLYEVSRRLERGDDVSWSDVFGAIRNGGKRDLGWMALVTTFTFFIWMDISIFLYAMFFGMKAPSPWALIVEIATTQHGLVFLAVGNLVGACIAFFVFSITVVSFPMLLDRDVDFVTAMVTSVRVVRRNLSRMLVWAVMIGLQIAFILLSGLAAMLFVLPWLGHATWHVYRRAVAPEAP